MNSLGLSEICKGVFVGSCKSSGNFTDSSSWKILEGFRLPSVYWTVQRSNEGVETLTDLLINELTELNKRTFRELIYRTKDNAAFVIINFLDLLVKSRI